MSVYVDPLMSWPKSDKWPYDCVSHMYSDTPAELHQFAKAIGLRREWCSDKTQPGSQLLHYDLQRTKRALAVRMGALEVDHEHGRAYYRPLEVRKAEVDAVRKRLKGEEL